MNDAWIGVIAALGGVALTGLIALVTAILNHRWTATEAREARHHELDAQRAEIRRVAYARLLASWRSFSEAVGAAKTTDPARFEVEDTSELMDELVAEFYGAHAELMRGYQSAEAEASLVAGDEVFNALRAHEEAAFNYVKSVITADDSRMAMSEAEDAALAALMQAMRREQSTDLAM